MRVYSFTGVLPNGPGPLDLYLVIWKCIRRKNKAREFMHGIEKHLLDTFFIVGCFGILSWLLSVTKWGKGPLVLGMMTSLLS